MTVFANPRAVPLRQPSNSSILRSCRLRQKRHSPASPASLSGQRESSPLALARFLSCMFHFSAHLLLLTRTEYHARAVPRLRDGSIRPDSAARLLQIPRSRSGSIAFGKAPLRRPFLPRDRVHPARDQARPIFSCSCSYRRRGRTAHAIRATCQGTNSFLARAGTNHPADRRRRVSDSRQHHFRRRNNRPKWRCFIPALTLRNAGGSDRLDPLGQVATQGSHVAAVENTAPSPVCAH